MVNTELLDPTKSYTIKIIQYESKNENKMTSKVFQKTLLTVLLVSTILPSIWATSNPIAYNPDLKSEAFSIDQTSIYNIVTNFSVFQTYDKSYFENGFIMQEQKINASSELNGEFLFTYTNGINEKYIYGNIENGEITKIKKYENNKFTRYILIGILIFNISAIIIIITRSKRKITDANKFFKKKQQKYRAKKKHNKSLSSITDKNKNSNSVTKK